MSYMEKRPTIVDVEGDVEMQARTRNGDEGPAVELLIGPTVPAGERAYRMIVPAFVWRSFVRNLAKELSAEEKE